MAFDSINLVHAIFLLLSIVMVALAASTVQKSNKKFTKGQVQDLGKWVFFGMVSLLGKLLMDFLTLIAPSVLAEPEPVLELLYIFETVFVVLTAIFLIKVATMVKELAKIFGFKMD